MSVVASRQPIERLILQMGPSTPRVSPLILQTGGADSPTVRRQYRRARTGVWFPHNGRHRCSVSHIASGASPGWLKTLRVSVPVTTTRLSRVKCIIPTGPTSPSCVQCLLLHGIGVVLIHELEISYTGRDWVRSLVFIGRSSFAYTRCSWWTPLRGSGFSHSRGFTGAMYSFFHESPSRHCQ
jgi:hypothetical protein